VSDFSTALVTGASSGFGRALSLALAKRGTHVYAAARRKPELDALVEEGEGRIEALVLDVSNADATYQAVADLDARASLDLVIANAGIGGPTPAQRPDWPLFKRILDVDLLGAAATITGALPGMVSRERGHVVGISSLAAFHGLPHSGAYSAAKSGLAAMLESFRHDLYGSNVYATTIFPGFVKTPLTQKNRFKMPFLMELDQAIRIMLRAIDRRQATCAFPLPTAIGSKMLKWLPNALIHRVASKQLQGE
jgi:short-subunit dehydrogenase